MRTEEGVRAMEPTFTFTPVYRRVPEGYAAFVEELPGANSQGATLAEARENLREAVALVLEANRSLHREIHDLTARKICKDLEIPESNG
jgi:predicted RNase H-like HicB family nuclease